MGDPRPQLDQPLPHHLPSPFHLLRAGLEGTAASIARGEQSRGSMVIQSQRYMSEGWSTSPVRTG